MDRSIKTERNLMIVKRSKQSPKFGARVDIYFNAENMINNDI